MGHGCRGRATGKGRVLLLALLVIASAAVVLGPPTRGQAIAAASDQPATVTGARSRPLLLGVNAHPLSDGYVAAVSPTALADEVASLGARIVRIDVHWSWVERYGPGQASWSPTVLARFADFLKEAQARHLQVLVDVNEAPCWASSDPHKSCDPAHLTYTDTYPPTNPQDYANFLARLVSYAGPRVQYWEIWDEPNLTEFWPNPDPAAYTRLVQAAYPAIKTANPGATVLAGALAPVDGGYGGIDTPIFLEGMYAAGIGGDFDALSFHPYTMGHPPTSDDPQWPMFSFTTAVPTLHAIMRAAGDPRSLWLTEGGWSTISAASCADCRSPWTATTEAQQASYLAQAARIAADWPYVPAFLWYEINDAGPSTARSYQDHFGLFRFDQRPKPAVAAFQDFSAGRRPGAASP
jgi:hypothetical protein